MAKKCMYNFIINKELLPKLGKRIKWDLVKEVEVYLKEFKNSYLLKVEDLKRNSRSETFILFSYNNINASEYIRIDNLTNSKLEKYFIEFGIIEKEIEDIPDISKICNVCKKSKHITDFEKNKSCSDGHAGTCKICRKARRKRYKRTCLTCNSTFESIYKNAKYCRLECKPQHIEKR